MLDMHYARVPARAIYGVLIALSCGAYLNTLFASFAFDDNFAVVRALTAQLPFLEVHCMHVDV